MKAVIFAGGLGTRMGSDTENTPKPMLEIGQKPMVWHIMSQLWKQGVSDFVILGGYRCGQILEFFDKELRLGDSAEFDFRRNRITSISQERDWKVTVVDTGVASETGERLRIAKDVIGEEPFLCTYGDGLADISFDSLLEHHEESRKTATISVSRARSRFGQVTMDESGNVLGFAQKPELSEWISIGYMMINGAALAKLEQRQNLGIEEALLIPLASSGELSAYIHTGNFLPVDTPRELREANNLLQNGEAFWVND